MRAPWIILSAMLLSAALSLSARADRSLYADLGERAGIERIANAAVSLWLADDRVKDDFDNINLDRLKGRLVDQLCQLAEGPCVYKGRSMAASHKGLHLIRAKFNAVAEDLQTAMEQAGIAYWTQNRLMARLAPMQRDIVTR